MELLYLLLVIGLSVFNLGKCKSLQELLQEEAKKLAAVIPSNVWNLVSNVRQVSQAFTEEIEKNELSRLQGPIDKEIFQKYKEILNGNAPGAINSFYFAYPSKGFRLRECIGAAIPNKNDPNYFTIALITTDVIADPKQILVYYNVRRCKRRFLRKKCWTTTHSRPRGFTMEEFETIYQGLKGMAYKGIMSTLSKELLLNATEKFLNENDQSLNFESLRNFNKNQTVLESGKEIFSLDKTKKVALTRNGQLYIGDADFNNYNDEKKAKLHGVLMGEKRKRTKKGFILQVTDEGNIAITNGKEYTYLSSNSKNKGIPPYQISVTNDNNFIIYDSQFRPIFDRKGKFKKATRLVPQGFRLYSENGEFYLIVETSGRIVVYKDNAGKEEDKLIWENGYADEVDKEVPPYSLVVESTGKLREVNGKGKTLWKTSKLLKGIPPYNLIVNNDGTLNLVDLRKKVIWKN